MVDRHLPCGITTSFLQLVLARVAVGVGEATSTPATTSVIADYFPPHQRTSAAAVLVLAIPLGALIASAGGGYVAQYADWRTAFVIAGLPGFVLALLLVLTVREPIRGHYDAPALRRRGRPVVLHGGAPGCSQRPAFLHVVIASTVASMGGFGINLFLASYFVRRFGLHVGEGVTDVWPDQRHPRFGQHAGRRPAR